MKLQFHIILLLILCVITSKRSWVFATTPINPERMSSCMSNNNAYPKKKIIFTCLLRNFLYSLVVIRFLLFLSGDVELKPGPPLNYTQFTSLMKKYNDQVLFLHQNCQSVLGQRLLLKNFLSDLGDNYISGFSETWLKSVNDFPFWSSIHSEYLMSSRCDRRTDLQEKNEGGGILLFVPKKGHPKARNDLETMSKDYFKSVWVECKMNKKPALMNLAYCPKTTNKFVFGRNSLGSR